MNDASSDGRLAGIAGRRRPTIPYQAFNLTQTTTFNPKTGIMRGDGRKQI
jgi:hypothetical protein